MRRLKIEDRVHPWGWSNPIAYEHRRTEGLQPCDWRHSDKRSDRKRYRRMTSWLVKNRWMNEEIEIRNTYVKDGVTHVPCTYIANNRIQVDGELLYVNGKPVFFKALEKVYNEWDWDGESSRLVRDGGFRIYKKDDSTENEDLYGCFYDGWNCDLRLFYRDAEFPSRRCCEMYNHYREERFLKCKCRYLHNRKYRMKTSENYKAMAKNFITMFLLEGWYSDCTKKICVPFVYDEEIKTRKDSVWIDKDDLKKIIEVMAGLKSRNKYILKLIRNGSCEYRNQNINYSKLTYFRRQMESKLKVTVGCGTRLMKIMLDEFPCWLKNIEKDEAYENLLNDLEECSKRSSSFNQGQLRALGFVA